MIEEGRSVRINKKGENKGEVKEIPDRRRRRGIKQKMVIKRAL